jgi:hypothetical protein
VSAPVSIDPWCTTDANSALDGLVADFERGARHDASVVIGLVVPRSDFEASRRTPCANAS